MSRYLKMIAWFVVLSSVLNACASTAKGKLTLICGAQEDWCQAMTKAFQKGTGIPTNYVRLSCGEAVARIEAGKDNPEFDVWHGGPADCYIVAKNKGLLEAYISPNAAIIPEQYKDKNGYWTGVYWGALGFCSNKKMLDEIGVPVPLSWDDLLDPRLKNLVAISHPATSGTGYTAAWTLVTLNDEVDKEAKAMDKTFAYFKGLHKNTLLYPKTGVAPAQMAGRGEVAIGISFSHDCVKYYEEGMKGLVVSFPQEGTGYEIGGVAVIKGAKNPEVAQKYVDWVLTAQSQEIPATVRSYQRPTNPSAKVPPQAFDPSKVNLIDYDFEKAAAHKDAVVKRFIEEIASGPKQ